MIRISWWRIRPSPGSSYFSPIEIPILKDMCPKSKYDEINGGGSSPIKVCDVREESESKSRNIEHERGSS